MAKGQRKPSESVTDAATINCIKRGFYSARIFSDAEIILILLQEFNTASRKYVWLRIFKKFGRSRNLQNVGNEETVINSCTIWVKGT